MLFRTGSSGPEVYAIQQRLKELGYYRGPLDSVFGGGTESAVRSFQKESELSADGIVGRITWAALFDGADSPAVDMTARPVGERCLALTGSFETGVGVPECFAGLTGDFDQQGISFGALQWNIGQLSLQPLLAEFLQKHRPLAERIFHQRLGELERMLRLPHPEQLSWARSIQNPLRHEVLEPWRGMFKTLGRSPECQSLQAVRAAGLVSKAAAMTAEYGLVTERALALMFDILTQNGSISRTVKSRILADFSHLQPHGDSGATEVAKMRIIANRRAEASRARFVEDVRSRKLTIADGRGTVHGIVYNLETQYGLRLTAFSAIASGAGG